MIHPLFVYNLNMTTKGVELRNDGHETERFADALRKIVSVPKKDVDAQLEKERLERLKIREQKRKA